MNIKKYKAYSLKEAINSMKNELGPDAIILGTRTIIDDNEGMKFYEITAGLDKMELVDEGKPVTESLSDNKRVSLVDVLHKNAEKKIKENQKQRLLDVYKVHNKSEDIDVVSKTETDIDKKLEVIIKSLKGKEVQKSVLDTIVEQLKRYKNFLTTNNLENYIKTLLGSLILTKNFNLEKGKQNKVIALVGPTGVGKTTTIAKLALISKIIHKLDVGLISIDTFRLGAIDQLKSFADVSHTDFLVAYEPKDLQAIMKKFSKKDIIFIDTVGRNHKNELQLKSNLQFLSNIKIDEIFLVLSATSSTRNLIDISKKFKIFNYSSFIVSKIDEAVVHGNIINLSTKTGIPISFLTNGQTIPDDIISADKDYLAKLIYTGQLA